MATAAGPRRNRFVPGVIALAALLAIGIIFGAGADLTHPSPHSLSGRDISSQIELGIQTEKGLTNLPTVTCPSSEPVKAGLSFECSVTGLPRAGASNVEVTEVDGRGHLRWQLVSP